MTPRVVVLNGVGSVGKTSAARSLQRIASRPMLHIAMDNFIDMLPPPLLDDPAGMVFMHRRQNGHPVIDIHSGPIRKRLLRGMRYAIAAMASQDNDIIVDDVISDPDDAEDCPISSSIRHREQQMRSRQRSKHLSTCSHIRPHDLIDQHRIAIALERIGMMHADTAQHDT